MSVLINGMDMPREGTVMVVCEVNRQPCVVVRGAEPYPLVLVLPHGRLVDADAFFEDFPEIRDYEYASNEYTVIPADRSKE